ncbi:hypothetical protein C8R47DRAFT_1083542 [Mycena vitilis]|nr:hypothetical protein C8R47DRAFT_1085201 [Mycena vitilis]KAJ6453040.1 hypothetical protein C8R47DRAFT_1083542 [Mycena vitilis]
MERTYIEQELNRRKNGPWAPAFKPATKGRVGSPVARPEKIVLTPPITGGNYSWGTTDVFTSLQKCLNSSLEFSIKLAAMSKKSWAKDLMSAASKLPFACPGPDLQNATSKIILDYAKSVDTALMLQWIQNEVDSSDKLYLLKGRREPQKDEPPAPQTLRLRH